MSLQFHNKIAVDGSETSTSAKQSKLLYLNYEWIVGRGAIFIFIFLIVFFFVFFFYLSQTGILTRLNPFGGVSTMTTTEASTPADVTANTTPDASSQKKVPSTGTETKKSPSRRKGSRKVSTLFSMGILSSKKKKHNEYFGGDSTVVSGGDEGEENENENDDGNSKKDN